MRLWSTILAALLLAVLSACGGGGTRPAGGSSNTGQPPAHSSRQIGLSLTEVPAAGGPLVVRLAATNAASLYQMSLRVAYDPRAVRPLDVERGALVDERAVFFAPTDKPAALEAAYVPVAFTYHQGESISAASGELLSLRFEVLDSGRDPGLHLIQSQEYLIARDSAGQNLQVLTGAGDE